MKRELAKNCPAIYYFLKNRVAPIWNFLPDYVFNAMTINQYKNKLDECFFKTVAFSFACQSAMLKAYGSMLASSNL